MATLTADQLIQYLSWAIYVIIFIQVFWRLIRSPQRANLNIGLFFFCTTLIIGISLLLNLKLVPEVFGYVTSTALLMLPYLLLRLLDDLMVLPHILRRVVGGLQIGAVLTIWLLPLERPAVVNLTLLVFVLALLGCAIFLSVRATLTTYGITRRRMAAVGLGTLFLLLNMLTGSLSLLLPVPRDLLRVLVDLWGLASGICYYLGFAPPGWLRRTWQEPELRGFLSRVTQLTRLPDLQTMVQALEQGAANSTGAPAARLGLWKPALQALHFPSSSDAGLVPLSSSVPAARAFREQRAIFSPHTRYDEPDFAELDRSRVATAVLVAPIGSGNKRMGVLLVYAPRAPLFAEDDLELLRLLADQAAVLLENRALIDETADIRARAEASRFKEDFLSAAAHDLKTPLTTLIALAQLLERRVARDPNTPPDQNSIQRLVQEGQRLRALVLELLDAAHVQQGSLLGQREAVDLVEVARGVCERQSSPLHACVVEASDPVVGLYDAQRIAQLLENLVENAVKYSPGGGVVRVSLRQDHSGVHLSVSDAGIGIPTDDMPYLFERFHRGTNVDDRRFPGMGLGLFICKGIVEQHGGRIAVSSRLGEGSTFHVTLPLVPARAAMYAA